MSDTDWANWWCCTWRWMHPGWQPWVSGQAVAALSGLSRSRHADLLQCLGVTPSPPPPPVAEVMHWLSLNAAQQVQALWLVQTICCAVSNDPHTGSEEDWAWCRGVAKALRPGRWLSDRVIDARALLGSWLTPDCWTRLRLGWSPDETLAPAQGVPARKLDALWRAVLWRVST